jgi:hypothetical protein
MGLCRVGKEEWPLRRGTFGAFLRRFSRWRLGQAWVFGRLEKQAACSASGKSLGDKSE